MSNEGFLQSVIFGLLVGLEALFIIGHHLNSVCSKKGILQLVMLFA